MWQLPNYHALEYGFKIVENHFKDNPKQKIVNCTVGGNLDNFERKELSVQLKESKFGNKLT